VPVSARPHFSIAGIPVRVEPFFLIIAVLFGMRFETLDFIAAWVGIMFVSILVHELGHGFALKAFGQPSSIVLHGFGGVTVSSRRAVLSRARSIFVSVAGSATALLLLWLPARTALNSDWGHDSIVDHVVTGRLTWGWVLYYAAFANLWWSIANLLPIRPLDGGNVASQLIGVHRARILSIAVCAAAALWIFTQRQDQRFAGIFAIMLGVLNLAELRAAKQGNRMTAFDVEAPDGSPPGRRGRRRRSHLRSVREPSPVPPAAPSGASGTDAVRVEQAAWSALSNGDHRRARTLLERLRGATDVSPFLTPATALASGAEELAIDLYTQAWLARPQGPSQLVASQILGSTGAAVEVAHRLVASAGGIEPAGTLQTHLHYAGCYEAAAEVGQVVADAGPASPPQTAFETACSWARAGQVDRAVEWLERAADAGFRAPSLVDGEPDLATVRADPRWSVIRARLA
jgi:stage IV sporulation protein FB